MSQVFGADSVNGGSNVAINPTAETAAVLGNFVSPPFGNAKAIVMGALSVQAGTGATSIAVRVRRNPNAENVLVGQQVILTVSAGNSFPAAIVVADPIPDGRQVQYQMTVQQTGASGTANVSGSAITTLLISG
jgi:hypothetical protein